MPAPSPSATYTPLTSPDAPPLANVQAPDLPQRRSVRLAGYAYSQPGWYFVTIVTQHRQPLFGHITAEARLASTPLGAAVSQCWHDLTTRYAQLHADCWVLMPDHVHLLLGVLPASPRRPGKPLGQVIGAFKAACTRLGRPWLPPQEGLWQRNYHEHIIRTPLDLDNHRQYVRDNPRRWLEKRELL